VICVSCAWQQGLNQVEFVIVNVNKLLGGVNLFLLGKLLATNQDAKTLENGEVDGFAVIGLSSETLLNQLHVFIISGRG